MWPEVMGDFVAKLLHFQAGVCVKVADGAAHHVSVDISAGPLCGHPNGIDRPDHFPKPVLADSMELDTLAGGDTNGLVAHFVGHLVKREVLVRTDFSTGDLDAQHKDPCLVHFCFSAFGTEITVVLLVATVEFHQLVAAVVEM